MKIDLKYILIVSVALVVIGTAVAGGGGFFKEKILVEFVGGTVDPVTIDIEPVQLHLDNKYFNPGGRFESSESTIINSNVPLEGVLHLDWIAFNVGDYEKFEIEGKVESISDPEYYDTVYFNGAIGYGGVVNIPLIPPGENEISINMSIIMGYSENGIDLSDDKIIIDLTPIKDWNYVVPDVKSITVLSPNSGEQLKIGEQYLIEWATTGDIDQVFITLTKSDKGIENIFWDIDNSGSSLWTAYSWLESGNDYKIVVSDMDGIPHGESDYFSISDDITVVSPVITVISPNSESSVRLGENLLVEWTAEEGSNFISITLIHKNGYMEDLVSQIPSNDNVFLKGLFPEDYEKGTYKIRVTDHDSGNYGESEWFQILPYIS